MIYYPTPTKNNSTQIEFNQFLVWSKMFPEETEEAFNALDELLIKFSSSFC